MPIPSFSDTRPTPFLLLTLAAFFGVTAADSQQKLAPAAAITQPQSRFQERGWDDAANRWQLTPIDVKTQVDTVSPPIRAQRNAYWMQPTENEVMRSVSNGSPLPGLIDACIPEVSVIKGITNIWIIATLESVHVYSIDPEQSLLYSEANMRVSRIIKEPNDLHFPPRSLLDINYLGGAIKTSAGEIKYRGLAPRQYAPQLGHTYILQLLYNTKYDTLSIYKQWDVTSGIVQPDDRLEVYRASQGKSLLKGQSASKAIDYLQSVLLNEEDGK